MDHSGLPSGLVTLFPQLLRLLLPETWAVFPLPHPPRIGSERCAPWVHGESACKACWHHLMEASFLWPNLIRSARFPNRWPTFLLRPDDSQQNLFNPFSFQYFPTCCLLSYGLYPENTQPATLCKGVGFYQTEPGIYWDSIFACGILWSRAGLKGKLRKATLVTCRSIKYQDRKQKERWQWPGSWWLFTGLL